ncbi:MAG: DoxX family membrane protein [Nocardioidaceae bacterium]|nr:DoxX family membrane protein [Nocardioidaceae bacterium]NUS52756.1 DoxX family membrane protein [Nocardioidaceae bacterium]
MATTRTTRGARRLRDLGETATAVVRPMTLPGLRVVLGALFVWFGALKVVGVSPVTDLVARTLPWLPGDVVVPALGMVEVVLGVALMTGVGLRLALLVMCLHLGGTFLTFLMAPAMMFRHDDPLLLTTDGEFVVKNLVLITAGLVLLTHAGRAAARPGLVA